MSLFKLKCDRMYETWWRDFYEIEAPSVEEAIEIILSGEVEPYDTECLPELNITPIKTEILDANYEKVYESQ